MIRGNPSDYASIYNGLAHCIVADPEEGDVEVNTTRIDMAPGDVFLLTSDGVHDVISDERLRISTIGILIWRRRWRFGGTPCSPRVRTTTLRWPCSDFRLWTRPFRIRWRCLLMTKKTNRYFDVAPSKKRPSFLQPLGSAS